ncbi:hypothetical protein [Chitiniphilus eburneus]|uniref:hypothetical protein n=1 Tax=Chitiniphilus eburneus TaxID=2571148 RepID=UPI0035CEC111
MPKKLGWLYPYALLYFFFIIVAFYFPDVAPMADEGIHLNQIERIYSGDFSVHPALTTIPGYHWLMALLTMPFDHIGVVLVRRLNAFLALGTVTILMMLTYQVRKAVCASRLTQLVFLPIALPFYFLIYTDSLSLMLILLCLSLGLSQRLFLAAVVGTLSIGVRQNNIVWLAMMPFLIYATQGGKWKWPPLKQFLWRCWPFSICAAAFLTFYIINGGVAMGDQWAHPAFRFYCGNFFFLLLVYAALFFPGIIARLPQTWAYVRSQPALPQLLALLFAVYLFGFNNTHPYNQIYAEYFLRNAVLMEMVSSIWIKVLFFIPLLLALTDFVARCQGRPAWAVIGVFTVLAVLPAWLIEQRYYIIPFVLMVLYREEETPKIESLTSFYYVLLGVIFTYGMLTHRFFM